VNAAASRGIFAGFILHFVFESPLVDQDRQDGDGVSVVGGGDGFGVDALHLPSAIARNLWLARDYRWRGLVGVLGLLWGVPVLAQRHLRWVVSSRAGAPIDVRVGPGFCCSGHRSGEPGPAALGGLLCWGRRCRQLLGLVVVLLGVGLVVVVGVPPIFLASRVYPRWWRTSGHTLSCKRASFI
jgi:hypothetical protein